MYHVEVLNESLRVLKCNLTGYWGARRRWEEADEVGLPHLLFSQSSYFLSV